MYHGSRQENWVASIADPLLAGWRYEETPKISVINGNINQDTGQFSITARINDNALANTTDLYLSVESRTILGADGFCLPGDNYSQIPLATGKIPDNLKSVDHYHLDTIQWIDPPTISGDTMRFAGKASPGVVRLTWQEGYCSRFHLYELDERGYHYIGSLSPLLPGGRFWSSPVIAEVTSQRTAADGSFEAVVEISDRVLQKYQNPVLAVKAQSILDKNTNQCSESDTLSAINIQFAAALLSPTPTPAPALPPTPNPTPSAPPATPASSTPTPTSVPLHDTQNLRWLQSVHPGIYRQLQELPWVKDGLSERERKTIDELLYIGVGDIANLKAVIGLAWVQDEISDTEYHTIYLLHSLNYYNYEAAASIITMPFLETLEYDDLLAIRGINSLAYDGLLSTMVETSAWQSGFTDAQTTLVATAGTLNNHQEISRMMSPGYASVETVYRQTGSTPNLKISIVRTGTQSGPWATAYVKDAVEFAEQTMKLSLPVSHVILVLNDNAVTDDFAGVNHGYAISYRPEYEQDQSPYGLHKFREGIVHEVAHYYWSGNEDWIDEGLANTFEYMHGLEEDISPGLLRNQRKNCEVYDIEALSSLNPSKTNTDFYCNYHLGQMLFQELLENLGDEVFSKRLRELYRLSLVEQATDRTPGIRTVRQVFQGQTAIINKHWYGKLNTPENRPFDEGVEWRNHGLVQWDQYPTYDSGSVTFSGKLLGDAVLSNKTIAQKISGGYSNFSLRRADQHEILGSILPPLRDGRKWRLDDTGDSVATRYLLEDDGKTFVVEFPFPKTLTSPSDYVVIVWGFQDRSRTPFIGEIIDVLGYARIRIE